MGRGGGGANAYGHPDHKISVFYALPYSKIHRMHSAQQIMFEDANFLVDIDTAAKTLLSIGNTKHHAPGAWYKWCKWCMVNCTLFDFFQHNE